MYEVFINHIVTYPPMQPLSFNQALLLHLFCYLVSILNTLLNQLALLEINYKVKHFLSGVTVLQILNEQVAMGIIIVLGSILVLTSLGIYFSKAAFNTQMQENVQMTWEYLMSLFGLFCLKGLRVVAEMLPIALSLSLQILSAQFSGLRDLSQQYKVYLLILIALLSIIQFLFVSLILQNYQNRKDFCAVFNSTGHFLWKTISLLVYILYSLYIPGKIFGLIVPLSNLLLFVVQFSYFSKQGLTMLQTFRLRLMFSIHLLLQIALALALFLMNLDLFYQADSLNYGPLVILTPIILISGLTIFNFEQINQIVSNEKSQIYTRFNLLTELLQESSTSPQDQILLRGLIMQHYIKKCHNLQCFSHKETLFDSKKKRFIDRNRILQNKSSFVKFLVKCEFQVALQEKPDCQLELGFAQFLYKKLRILPQVIQITNSLRTGFLSLIQSIKLARIIELIQINNAKLNHELYQGQLDIQNLIFLQENFNFIIKVCKDVLKSRLMFWETFIQNQLDLDQTQDFARASMEPLPQIRSRWKLFQRYFQVHRKWRFFYAFYTYFIQNQKLKIQMLESLNKESDIIRDVQGINLFQDESCVLQTDSSGRNIINTSFYFSINFQYTFGKNQICQCTNIDQIFLEPLIQPHKRAFQSWNSSGESTIPQKYFIRNVLAVTKSGFLYKCKKVIKQIITAEGQSNFMALLSVCEQSNEPFIVTDKSLNILGMSREAFMLLQLNSFSSSCREFTNVNAVLIFPRLIQFIPKSSLSQFQSRIFNLEQTKAAKIFSKNNSNFYKLNIPVSITTDLMHFCKSFLNVSKKVRDQESKLIDVLSIIRQQQLTSISYFTKQVQLSLSFHKSFNIDFCEIRLSELLIERTSNVFKLQIPQRDAFKYQKQNLFKLQNIYLKEENNLPATSLQSFNYISLVFLVHLVLAIAFLIIFIQQAANPFSTIYAYYTHLIKVNQVWLIELYSVLNVLISKILTDANGWQIDVRLNLRLINNSVNVITNDEFRSGFQYIIYNDYIFPPQWYFHNGFRINQIQSSERVFYDIITMLDSNTTLQISQEKFRYSMRILPQASRLFQLAHHEMIKTIANSHKNLQVWSVVVLTIFLFLGLISVVAINFILNKVAGSLNSIIESFSSIRPQDIMRIKNYEQRLITYFNNIFRLDPSYSDPHEQEPSQIKTHKRNKSSGMVSTVSNLITRSKCGLAWLAMGHSVLFVLILGLFYLFVDDSYRLFEKIEIIENVGYIIPKYIFGVYSSKLAVDLSKPFSPESQDYLQFFLKYQDNLSLLISRTNEVSLDSSDQNESAIRTLLLENACSQVDICPKNQSSIFVKGQVQMIKYLRTYWKQILSNNLTLNPEDINQANDLLYYHKRFYYQIIDLWSNTVQNRTLLAFTLLIVASVVVSILVALTIRVAVSWYFVGRLQQSYAEFMQILRQFMPEQSINKQKIAKAKLIIHGILRK